MKFSEAIHYYRNICDMTQADLDRTAGLPSTTVAQYEQGGRQPTLSNLIKLITVFNARMGTRFDWNEFFDIEESG